MDKSYTEAALERIAAALERQVAQHDEAVTRNLALREDSIKRHDQQRDSELAEARAMNQTLLLSVERALQVNRDQLAYWKTLAPAPSADAVDPVGEKVTG